MERLGRAQRRVRLRWFVQQLEHAPGLLAVEPDDHLAFEDFLCLAVGRLDDEVIERRTFEVGGGLDGCPHTGRNTGDQTGLLFSDGWHGAKMAPAIGKVKNVFDDRKQISLTVTAHLTLRRALAAPWLDALFAARAERQYVRSLLFSTVVDLLAAVTFGFRPCFGRYVGAGAGSVGELRRSGQRG